MKTAEFIGLLEGIESKFKKGDVVQLKKTYIADLKADDPSIDFNTTQTAIVKTTTSSKNPGEPWRHRISFTRDFFGAKAWPEFMLQFAKEPKNSPLKEGGPFDTSAGYDATAGQIKDLLVKVSK